MDRPAWSEVKDQRTSGERSRLSMSNEQGSSQRGEEASAQIDERLTTSTKNEVDRDEEAIIESRNGTTTKYDTISEIISDGCNYA
jgi:hypothetical protein